MNVISKSTKVRLKKLSGRCYLKRKKAIAIVSF